MPFASTCLSPLIELVYLILVWRNTIPTVRRCSSASESTVECLQTPSAAYSAPSQPRSIRADPANMSATRSLG